MKINLRNSLSYYCFFVGFIIFLALSCGSFFLWKTGSFNINNISTVYESGLVLADIKENYAPKKVRKLVQSDQVREALTLMDGLKSKTYLLDESFSVESYDDLMLDHKRLKNRMKNLISYPKQEMIINVLNNKLSLFRSYVMSNRWRTLTRMSNLMAVKTAPKNIKSPGFFREKKLKSFIRGINQDLNRMAKITNDSVLGIIDKNDINKRLDDMRVETAMLNKYVSSLNGFGTDINRLEQSFTKWSTQIGPEITLRRLHLEKTSYYLKLFMIGLIVFTIVALILGYFLYRYTVKLMTKDKEDFVFEVINQGLMPLEEKFDTSNVSSRFVKNLEKARERFHHRISFGSVFQEALPFSSLLLDSNLNLSWANDLFFEQWNITDAKQAIAGSSGMSISWDFLQQYTNLGEDDPVQMALNDGIAGIYQVQLMSPVTKESLPFEMYVSPVEYARQKRIMIFFYPLRNVEETLANQVQSITGPISRTLDELSKDQFHGDIKERLENDFYAAGISKLFDKFTDYAGQMIDMQNDMHGEIDGLEEQLREYELTIDHFEKLQQLRKQSFEAIQKDFKECRQAVIELIELRYELEQTTEELSLIAKEAQDKQAGLVEISCEALERHEQSIVSIDKMMHARDQIKVLKDQLMNHKTKLIQDLDHALVSAKRRGVMDEALEASMLNVKGEVKSIEALLGDYSQVTRQLDVILSKATMMIERKEAPPIHELDKELSHLASRLDQGRAKISMMMSQGERGDAKVVDALKDLFDSYSTVTKLNEKLIPKAKTKLNHEEVAH